MGQDIMKGVYYALVLTVRNRRKISNRKSETKQRECHEGVLFTCLCYCIVIGASCCVVSCAIWCGGCVYISGVGFCVARLRLARHFLQPLTVKRATVQGFTLFLCLIASV